MHPYLNCIVIVTVSVFNNFILKSTLIIQSHFGYAQVFKTLQISHNLITYICFIGKNTKNISNLRLYNRAI